MGCMELDDDPEAAEPFFEAILAMYPFYISLWYAACCFYIKREMFSVADKIIELILE